LKKAVKDSNVFVYSTFQVLVVDENVRIFNSLSQGYSN